MPVTTRKQHLSNNKSITSTSKTLSQKTYDLDQLKQKALQTTVAGTSEMNIDCNLELEEPFVASMFDGFQSYESDIERQKELNILDNFSSCLMSPPMSEPCSPIARTRSASLAEAVVPSPSDVFYQETSAPTSPAQDEALNILDEIILSNFEQPAPFNQIEASPQPSCGYDLDDLFDFIESETSQPTYQTTDMKVVDFVQSQPESRQMYTQEQNVFCAAFTSQESFSAQSVDLVQNFGTDNQVFEHLIPEETINEIVSFETSCSSPAHSIESLSSGSQSPTYSSNGDEEYLPVAEIKRIKGIGGGRRGRKRKIDSEYGEDIQGAKKQKNAEAAKRYRMKKADAEKQAFDQLAEVEQQIKETRERFNEALKRRDLFLEILFDANEKANSSMKVKFPEWVQAKIAAKKY